MTSYYPRKFVTCKMMIKDISGDNSYVIKSQKMTLVYDNLSLSLVFLIYIVIYVLNYLCHLSKRIRKRMFLYLSRINYSNSVKESVIWYGLDLEGILKIPTLQFLSGYGNYSLNYYHKERY